MCHANVTPFLPLLLSPLMTSPLYSACPDLTHQVPNLYMEYSFIAIANVLSCLPQSLYEQFNTHFFIRWTNLCILLLLILYAHFDYLMFFGAPQVVLGSAEGLEDLSNE